MRLIRQGLLASWRIPFGVRGRVPAFPRGLVCPRRRSGVMPPHSKVLRHTDTTSEQVGHEAGFQLAQLFKLVFMTAYQYIVLIENRGNPFLFSRERECET